LFTVIHLRGIQFGARIQNYLTGLKVALIVGLVACGFLFGRGTIGHFLQGEGVSFNFSSVKTMGLGLLWIMFAYSGWNAATYIGAEIKEPGKNLPRSLFLGTVVVMSLYLLLNVLYIYAVPPKDMNGVIAIAGLAVGRLFGTSLEVALSLLIAFALFSSISAFIILGPRVYYAMARDGYFFKFVSDVNPIYQVPSKAIILQGALSIVMVLSGTFDQILTYMGFSLGIFPILAVMGVYRLRKQLCVIYTFRAIVPLIYIFSGIVMLLLAYLQRPIESSIAIGTVLVGIPVFWFFQWHYIRH
jgi:APA family basic amino acid/polyamine antiporter